MNTVYFFAAFDTAFAGAEAFLAPDFFVGVAAFFTTAAAFFTTAAAFFGTAAFFATGAAFFSAVATFLADTGSFFSTFADAFTLVSFTAIFTASGTPSSTLRRAGV